MGLPGLEEHHDLEESIDHGQHLADAVEVPIHVAIFAWKSRNACNDLKHSLAWFKGKFTGNHGFYHQIGWAFL